MQEGYWINYKTDKEFLIQEHSYWITEGNNAIKLGLSPAMAKNLRKFKLPDERDKLLIYVLKNAPVMRVRGHGGYVTFEYSSHNRTDPLDSIVMWAKRNGAGALTVLNIVNMATNEWTSMTWKEFQKNIDSDGYESIMRAASNANKKIVKELLAMAKSILRSRGV